MSRQHDPFRIPRAGLETAPLAGLASVDISAASEGFSGEFLAESTLGGVMVYAIYQALLTSLRTEALRRRGAITRAVQMQMIASTVWASTKQGAAVSLVLAVVLLVCPWLAGPLSLLGLVGIGKASLDLFHAFWDGLDEVQRAELLAVAMEAGVNLQGLVGDQRPSTAAA
ncbi:hypothetical protein KBY96_07845 [Cyanobium sp. ATX 6A2]|uniref:hypothetical protein n=1 Tax=Cyanobium sp. ATX 6A2 TaxID=2823700 RepID=UPI0020CB8638|nr:hypothetical protein [Cyanobium sp. ATX 6A2]MCP9887842.1 hypothetical protein [Cyanobium sp. ATX 6A2]